VLARSTQQQPRAGDVGRRAGELAAGPVGELGGQRHHPDAAVAGAALEVDVAQQLERRGAPARIVRDQPALGARTRRAQQAVGLVDACGRGSVRGSAAQFVERLGAADVEAFRAHQPRQLRDDRLPVRLEAVSRCQRLARRVVLAAELAVPVDHQALPPARPSARVACVTRSTTYRNPCSSSTSSSSGPSPRPTRRR